jgi:branched-chain amino acid aminotransferase
MRILEPASAPVPDAEQSHGCFETMRAYRGRIFRLDDHLDRLWASAQFLGTPLPSTRPALRRQLMSSLRRSGLREAVVRVALVPQRRGASIPVIMVQPAIIPPASAYRSGIRLAVVPSRKFPVSSIDPQAKYSARLGSVMAVMDAQLRGVEEALFLDSIGSVTESTASNFGIVKDGAVLTPPCWLGLLPGITRQLLPELGQDIGAEVREALLTRHDIYNADEAFLTSTLKEVIGVSRIDGRTIGSGRPGPVTQKLRRAFQALVRRELGA